MTSSLSKHLKVGTMEHAWIFYKQHQVWISLALNYTLHW